MKPREISNPARRPMECELPLLTALLLLCCVHLSAGQDGPVREDVERFVMTRKLVPLSWQQEMPAVPLPDHGLLCAVLATSGERWPRLIAWRIPGGQVLREVTIHVDSMTQGFPCTVIDVRRRAAREEIVAFLAEAILVYRVTDFQLMARIDPPEGKRFYGKAPWGATIDVSGRNALVGLEVAAKSRQDSSSIAVANVALDEGRIARVYGPLPEGVFPGALYSIAFWDARDEVVESRDPEVVRWRASTGEHVATHRCMQALFVLRDEPPGWLLMRGEMRFYHPDEDRLGDHLADLPYGVSSFALDRPRNRLFAGDTERGRIQVWSWPDIKLERELSGHGVGHVSRMQVSADGRWLYSAAAREWAVWDTETGERLLDQPIPGKIESIQFIPGAERFLTRQRDRGQLVEWDLATERPVEPAFVARSDSSHNATFHPRVDFSQGGERYLATDSHGNYELRATGTRELLWRAALEDGRFEKNTPVRDDGDPVESIAFVDADRVMIYPLLTDSGGWGTAGLIEMVGAGKVHPIDVSSGEGGPWVSVLYAPRGQVLVLAKPGRIEFRVFDGKRLAFDPIVQQTTKNRRFGPLALSPDGRQVASVERQDGEPTKIGIYSLAGARIASIEPEWSPLNIVESIAYISRGVLAVLETRDEVERREGERRVVERRRVSFFDISTGELISEILLPDSSGPPAMAVHRSGRLLLVAGEEGAIYVCGIAP